MLFRKLGVACAALTVAAAAAAEPVAVEYLAQRKPIKEFTATDVAVFSLYADADCTSEISSYPLFGGDEGAAFYLDKHHRIAGASRRVQAVRIRAIIDAPVLAAAPYLRVTGPGIVALGDACQLQAGSVVAGSGPSGPAGPAGEAGPQGPAGADGADGADGEMGPAGPAGPQGPAGEPGIQGEAGPVGPQGPAGEAGPQGAEGPMGPQGPAGETGPQGAEGPMGPAGPQGPAGEAGPQGAEGAMGPAGPQGAEGAMGPAGPQGAEGAMGPAGPQGAEGPMGPQGPAGEAGPQGAEGPMGPAGPQGPQGEPGTAGMSVEAEASTSSLSGTVSTALGGGSSDPERFCFLTGMSVEEIDSLDEIGSCRVVFDGATGWRLDATTGAGNAETICHARCLSW